MTITNYLQQARNVLDATLSSDIHERIESAIDAIAQSLKQGYTMMICGNGGSSADAGHITAELVGRFYKMERKALPCINLAADTATLTAWSNDYSYESVFARQVEAYGKKGAVLWGLSTSGNSRNVMAAFEKAREMGVITVGMTGAGGGKMAALSDHLLAVPSTVTPEIQQIHICYYHYMCGEIEKRVF